MKFVKAAENALAAAQAGETLFVWPALGLVVGVLVLGGLQPVSSARAAATVIKRAVTDGGNDIGGPSFRAFAISMGFRLPALVLAGTTSLCFGTPGRVTRWG
ncbi:hypothetical protein [Arthrobacter sp. ov118]|uniref:hypothetical protein n=1 Tax=Arthrobacter sp. ov118 TaxID=1761747 RepID=UPI00210AE82B|nr:hypothetical protein [Arthrobacter sp. ov118]